MAKKKQRHPMADKFHKLLKEVGDMHDRKQKDYGTDEDPFANVRASESFGIPGWLGCLIRANDKMRRLMAYAIKGKLANESVEDSMLDAAVYFLIALLLFRESRAEIKRKGPR